MQTEEQKQTIDRQRATDAVCGMGAHGTTRSATRAKFNWFIFIATTETTPKSAEIIIAEYTIYYGM